MPVVYLLALLRSSLLRTNLASPVGVRRHSPLSSSARAYLGTARSVEQLDTTELAEDQFRFTQDTEM